MPWKLKVVRSQSKIGDVRPRATAWSNPASRASISMSSRNDVEPATAQTVRISASARAVWLDEWADGLGRFAERLSRDRGERGLAARSGILASVARRFRRQYSAALSGW